MDADIPSDGRLREERLAARARAWASPGAPPLGRLARHAVALPAGQLRWALGRLPAAALDGLGGDPVEAAKTVSAGWLRDQLAALGPVGGELALLLQDAGGLTPQTLHTLLTEDPVLPAPVPGPVARRTVERALPGALASFDGEPLSVSPLHQLHRGVLGDGRAVLLRVLRPGARAELRDDLRLAANLLAPLALVPQARAVQPMAVLRTTARRAAEQTDLRHDARNTAELADLLGDRMRGLRLAEPVPELSAPGVAAFELPEGAVPLARADGAAVRAALPALLTLVVEAALADGVFHADLRPEHLFVLPDGTFLLAGCTAVGRLEPPLRRAFLDYVTSLFGGDFAGQVDALDRLGAVPEETDRAALEADLRAAPELAPLRLLRGGDAAARVLGEAAARHGLRLPAGLLGWARALLTYRSATRHLVPDMPFVQALLPLVPRLGEINKRLIADESG